MTELPMEVWLGWARGPLFWAALTFMVLGLARHVAITAWEMVRAVRRAGDKSIPARQVLAATVKWLFPVDRLSNRLFFSLTTVAFHVSVILVPIFLAGHIALWERGIGLSWPALPNLLATLLTVVAVVSALVLVIQRIVSRDTRNLSRFQDYALPLVIAVPFGSGFLVMHPGWNPFPYEATLLTHVLSANVLLILIPITKLSHMVLLPATQLVTELAWHFPPDAGSKVAVSLGKESEPI
jgi:nitrate reductase gamma subunit